jgi:elongation factor P hydroxylase
VRKLRVRLVPYLYAPNGSQYSESRVANSEVLSFFISSAGSYSWNVSCEMCASVRGPRSRTAFEKYVFERVRACTASLNKDDP